MRDSDFSVADDFRNQKSVGLVQPRLLRLLCLDTELGAWMQKSIRGGTVG
jgi:hypothetical protein